MEGMTAKSVDIKSKLVIKAVRNVRRGYETDGVPMVIRRARSLEKILEKMDIYIQNWERIERDHCGSRETTERDR